MNEPQDDPTPRLSHLAAVLRGPLGQEPLTSLDVETLECVEAAIRHIERLRAALEQITKESFAHIMVSIAREALRGAGEVQK